MKAVLMSIQPKWVEKIANGEKTIEVRKTAPKIETPVKCYIYCTQGEYFFFKEQVGLGKFTGYNNVPNTLTMWNQKVIGEFICDNIIDFWYDKGFYLPTGKLKTDTCLTNTEFYNYGKGKPLYGLHISKLKIYDKPKELGEFRKPCSDKYIKKYKYCQGCKHGLCADLADCWNTVNCPPQSWCYVEI